MNKRLKLIRTFLIISILGFFYSSCTKEESYSIIPAITYNSFIPFCSGSQTDSAYIRVNFTDGDGDIGYPQQDTSAMNNFYVLPELYNTTTKTFIVLRILQTGDTVKFSYRIPYITPSGKNKALNGIIQINLENLISYISENPIPGYNVNEYQFVIWMYDRAGHKSNVLTTPTVWTCQ